MLTSTLIANRKLFAIDLYKYEKSLLVFYKR